VILAERAPAAGLTAADQVAAFIYGRSHGKLGNAWREGLVSLCKSRGQVLTKRDARRAIESVWPRADAFDRCLLDLPRHLFPALLDAIGRSVQACAAGAAAAGDLP
jgi:N4-bis(aminopropyl)spermidine synthase